MSVISSFTNVIRKNGLGEKMVNVLSFVQHKTD